MIGFPFYLRYLWHFTENSNGSFLLAVALGLLDAYGKSVEFTIWGTYAEIAKITALILFLERDRFPRLSNIAVFSRIGRGISHWL